MRAPPVGRAAGRDREQIDAEARQLVADGGTGALAERNDGNDRRHADDDAQRVSKLRPLLARSAATAEGTDCKNRSRPPDICGRSASRANGSLAGTRPGLECHRRRQRLGQRRRRKRHDAHAASSSSDTGHVASVSAATTICWLGRSDSTMPSLKTTVREQYVAISGSWVTTTMVAPA